MKKIGLLFFAVFASIHFIKAQLTVPPNGGNKKASVSELIGITNVLINYDRPGVKGREGKIWGQLVPFGFTDQGFGTSTKAPWRAGANESTTIEFSTDVKVEGQTLSAGKYALFMDVEQDQVNIIFNKNTKAWGSFFYDPKEDVLKVNVKTQAVPTSVEWLTFDFSGQTDNSAVVALSWEKLKIPFKVEVDLIQTQLASFRKELTSSVGFRPDPWTQAAQFCVQNKTNLDEALGWADYAINGRFVGEKNFQTMSTKASVLSAMNRQTEADTIMKQAMPLANMIELHQYGRRLIAQGKKKEALEAFQLNSKKNPNVYTTNVGLARGYSANADYKNALKYAKAAEPQATDNNEKQNIQNLISKLEKGQDINQ